MSLSQYCKVWFHATLYPKRVGEFPMIAMEPIPIVNTLQNAPVKPNIPTMKHCFGAIYILLSLSLGSNALRVKKYKKAKLTSFHILKETSAPKSDLQCCSICMNEYICEGVKFDGTSCQILSNVKVDITSEDKNGWVDIDLLNPKSKFNPFSNDKVKLTVLKL